MGRKAAEIDRDKLERLYVRDGLSTIKVAERLGSNRETVRRAIHRFGFQMRSKGGKP